MRLEAIGHFLSSSTTAMTLAEAHAGHVDGREGCCKFQS
jgi:hypothetical protein